MDGLWHYGCRSTTCVRWPILCRRLFGLSTVSCEGQINKLLSFERVWGKGRLSFLASMCVTVAFRAPRNVRDEARPSSHAANKDSKDVGCAHASKPCMRTVLIRGRSLESSICLVWSLYRALEAIQATRGTPRGCYWLRSRSKMSTIVIFW
jgi:hypothetical protein